MILIIIGHTMAAMLAILYTFQAFDIPTTSNQEN